MNKYWLMKTEPDTFSFEDLLRVRNEPWNGIRNYQARNYMRDEMSKGDKVLFYHSSCDEPGIYGLAEITSATAYPDPTQFEPKSQYHDPKSTRENPRWMLVDVGNPTTIKRPLLLNEMRSIKELQDMLVLRKGQRLSIQPVEEKHYKLIVKKIV